MSHMSKEHEVLFNGDLLREVFRHLEGGRKVQLLAAALTCSTFAEPAQDSLWRTMHSIIPFLKLIPSFVNAFGSLCFVDDKPPSMHPRFQAHAVRVQRFHLEDAGRQIPAMAVTRLALLQGSRPLFPALRHVSFASGICIEDYALLLFGPSIVSMAVSNHHTNRENTSHLLRMLPTLSTKLTELALSGDSWLIPEALGDIAKMSSLRTLRLSLPANNLPFPSLHGLRDLETVHITAGEAFILQFLSLLPSRRLVNITLLRKDKQPWWIDSGDAQGQAPSFWHRCAEMLQEKAGHTLRSLSVQDLVAPDPFVSFKLRSFAQLLYPIHGLEHLDVGTVSQCAVAVTDEDYADMANAWPRIKSLHLLLPYVTPTPQLFGSSCSKGPRDHPTAGALAILAQSCHHLESLQLYLPSADLTDANITLPTNFWGNPSLKNLWLGSCSVVDPLSTSMHLSTLFPNLKVVAGVAPFPGSSNAVAHAGTACGFEWMSVRKHLAVIHDIRAAERLRVASILREEQVSLTGRARKLIHV